MKQWKEEVSAAKLTNEQQQLLKEDIQAKFKVGLAVSGNFEMSSCRGRMMQIMVPVRIHHSTREIATQLQSSHSVDSRH